MLSEWLSPVCMWFGLSLIELLAIIIIIILLINLFRG